MHGSTERQTEISSYIRLPGYHLVASHQYFGVTAASHLMKAVIFFRDVGTDPPRYMAPQFAPTFVYETD